MTDSLIGTRLQHARKLRGMTQVELAKAAGVKQASISDLERGESKSFRGATLVAVAQALKVRPDWLATGRGMMDGHQPPLPVEAERVARNWLRLAPEVRASVASMIENMVKVSSADQEAIPDEKVAAAYGRPGKRR